MDRKGIYRKGRAGHSRNINTYRLYRQNYKKWRLPFTAVLAFMLIFGLAPVVGEQFQTSLLTVQEASTYADANPQYAKKMLLDEVKSFTDSCAGFLMTQCENDGKALLTDMVNPNFSSDVRSLVSAVTNFEEKFLDELANNACKFDLGNAVTQVKPAQRAIQEVASKYPDSLGSAGLTDSINALNKAINGLDSFVESCAMR